MGILRIALLVGWASIELSKELIKKHNLKKEEQLKKQNTKDEH